MFREENLRNTIFKLGGAYRPEIFRDLSTSYSEAGRHYHDQTHVFELLTQFRTVQHLAAYPSEIEAAIWFHDAVYDTRRSDNEEKSAAWAESILSRSGVPDDSIARIVEMILATKSHKSDSRDTLIMVDIDLGILGSAAEAFERYDQAIRKEYHWAPEEAYRSGRLQVLTNFYERDRIFHTGYFFDKLEANARNNLRSKIDELLANGARLR